MTATRPEIETRKNVSRDRNQVSRLHHLLGYRSKLEVAGVTFSDSDSAHVPTFLNPGLGVESFQIWESGPVRTAVSIVDPTEIYPCFPIRNDHADSCCCCWNWKVSPDPGSFFHKFLNPDPDPGQTKKTESCRSRLWTSGSVATSAKLKKLPCPFTALWLIFYVTHDCLLGSMTTITLSCPRWTSAIVCVIHEQWCQRCGFPLNLGIFFCGFPVLLRLAGCLILDLFYLKVFFFLQNSKTPSLAWYPIPAKNTNETKRNVPQNKNRKTQ